MKIAAVYDVDGLILAAVELVEDGYQGAMPVARAGTMLGTFEVPERLARARLDEVCLSMRVEPKTGRLIDDH